MPEVPIFWSPPVIPASDRRPIREFGEVACFAGHRFVRGDGMDPDKPAHLKTPSDFVEDHWTVE